MDRLEAMAMLVAAVEAGSLSAASRRLQVPVATLSRKVGDLEAHLGARLLLRTTRKLALTEAGTAYIAAARQILAQIGAAEREAAGEFDTPRGELVITAPTLFGRLHVLPLVAEFLADHPQIDIRMLLADRTIDLMDDRVDMAVRIGRLPDSRLVATRVGALRVVTCASPELLTRLGEPREPADLRHRPCVATQSALLSTAWRFACADGGAPIDIDVLPRLVVNTPDAAIDAAVRGVGLVRLLHYQAVDAVRAGTLRIVLAAHEPEPVPVQLVHAARGQMPLKMRRFLDHAAPRLRAMLSKLAQDPASTTPRSTAATPRLRSR